MKLSMKTLKKVVFRVRNKDIRTTFQSFVPPEISENLWFSDDFRGNRRHRFGTFIVNFEYTQRITLVSLLIALNFYSHAGNSCKSKQLQTLILVKQINWVSVTRPTFSRVLSILAYWHSRFLLDWSNKNSRLEVLCEKDVLENFAKLIGKHLRQSLFFNKVTVWGLQFY